MAMKPPARYMPPNEVVSAWMKYIWRTERRWPTARELETASGVSKSRAAEYRRLFLEALEKRGDADPPGYSPGRS